MIKFPEDISDTLVFKTMELKIGRNRLKSLERAIRRLGDFTPKKDLVVIDSEYISESNDEIYEIKDLAETSFKFYNYGLDNNSQSITRYKMNFLLSMKRKKQEIEYIYDFSSYEYKDATQDLKLIAINHPITEKRKIRIELSDNKVTVIVSEEDKKYIIVLSDRKDKDFSTLFLQNYENIVRRLQIPEVLNLGEILDIIGNNKKLNYAYIYKQVTLLAETEFYDGQILNYRILEPDKRIEVTINDKITRNVNRKGIEPYQETLTNESEKFQKEYRRLLKQL